MHRSKRPGWSRSLCAFPNYSCIFLTRHKSLERMIVEERTSGNLDSRRLAELNVLLRFELKLAREKLVID